MIAGIGTDIVAVARLASLYERHGERALARLLSPAECAEFADERDPARFLAKRFAAKEAFGKALGSGLVAPGHLAEHRGCA
jgi:holo-[acyl-carrier protein] synthase